MTAAAERRLKVLQSLDTLGAGFQLASHDLDIRGAGNLLGEEQSGHIKRSRLELYQQMLEEAVAEAARRQGRGRRSWSPQINVGAPVTDLPNDYVPEPHLRLALYRRLSAEQLATTREIDALRRRDDRPFGPLPVRTRMATRKAA
jgi:transcription-repair coupling factor (superfamily II helicase)